MKRLLAGVVLTLGLLLVGMTTRAARYGSPQPPVEPVEPVVVDAGAAERLAGALRFRTVSHQDRSALDTAEFRGLHDYLEGAFPRVHAALRRERVSDFSLLYTWPGTEPSLRPVVLMGHLDVVPVEPGTEGGWTHDAFGGTVADRFVWGRGAVDNKSSVLGTLEAVEMLLAEGFRPRRTVLLAYGHDEEVGGDHGAKRIAELLEARGVEPEYVLDEGGAITVGMVPGISAPLALVGIAEKGFVSVELTVEAEGGHSSMPPRETAVGILSAALARLEAEPMPARLVGPTREFVRTIGAELPLAQRVVFANLWAFEPLLIRRLEATPGTNALVRTTTAPTMLEAGTKENVLASRARAVVNFRILPGDDIEGVLEHVRRVVDDRRVRVQRFGDLATEASPVSSTAAVGFQAIRRSLLEVAPDVAVSPYLVVGATDARHFARLSENVYRLLPVRMGASDLARMHGTDERVRVEDYLQAVRFYRQLLLNTTG